MRVTGIVVACGQGWAAAPERYVQTLAGEALLAWAVRAVAPHVGDLVVLAPEAVRVSLAALLRDLRLPGRVLTAGPDRSRSVRDAMAVLGAQELVLVHDFFRPFARPALFKAVLTEASSSGAAACATPVEDVLLETDEMGRAIRMPHLHRTRVVQAPQAFVAGLLHDSLEAAQSSAWSGPLLDEASSVVTAGGLVQLVAGDPMNRQVLGPAELAWAETHALRFRGA